jgi:hypothetical protein
MDIAKAMVMSEYLRRVAGSFEREGKYTGHYLAAIFTSSGPRGFVIEEDIDREFFKRLASYPGGFCATRIGSKELRA